MPGVIKGLQHYAIQLNSCDFYCCQSFSSIGLKGCLITVTSGFQSMSISVFLPSFTETAVSKTFLQNLQLSVFLAKSSRLSRFCLNVRDWLEI